MMRSAASLVRFYASHPRIAVRHLRRGIQIVGEGGVGQLHSLVAAKLGRHAGQTNHQREIRSRLVDLRDGRRSNVRAILDLLSPYAEDLPTLAVVQSDEERLRLVQAHILLKYSLLDEAFYRERYLGNDGSANPLQHYCSTGLFEGFQPNRFFDPREYLGKYNDVAGFGIDPVIHYALFGWKDGRSAGSWFDGEFYLAQYPDVAEQGVSPLVHFLQTGRKEFRAYLPNMLLRRSDRKPVIRKGTIIVVCHDAGLGGAQQVAKILTQWLIAATHYDIKLVTMRGGPFVDAFSKIAPTLDISSIPEDQASPSLRAFAGEDVKAVFINSVASGDFLNLWRDETPIISFIHELPKVLKMHAEKLDLIKGRATAIIGGSQAVTDALKGQFGIEADRLQTVHAFIESIDPDRLVDFDRKGVAKKALSIDPETFVVTACGMIHWRKSPEKFIEVAAKFSTVTDRKVRFIWIGGGPDQDKCERLASEAGLGDIVEFTGYEPNILRYLNASDVFLLPSEEDPFPLVCLYAAMALNPIVCFEEAGGMPEFVANGCGQVVPFGDEAAMADAVMGYLADDELRRQEAAAGRRLVESDYTVASVGPKLLHAIREAAGLPPHVSVIVPNYNYERFLPERLVSIERQSFQDFEVILLDDQSSDGSVALLDAWAARRPATRVIVNEKNSGSPFAQWLKGIRLSKSELIWIAEADDACEPSLLANLVPYFGDRNVFLGYVKSVPVDEKGSFLGDYEELYLDRIAAGRWARPYIVTDHVEANAGLGIANCIPNASSVVFRRFEPEPEFECELTGMRMCGDWLFYLRAMRGGMVCYSGTEDNFHRRHGDTVTHSMEGSPRYFDELASVRDYVRQTYRLDDAAREGIERFTQQDLDRFGVTDQETRVGILKRCGQAKTSKALPTVLVVVSDLSPGGGQLFGIRIANAWAARGGRAILLNVRKYPDHPQVVSRIDGGVTLFHADTMPMTMIDLIDRFDIDVIHSSMWWADRYVHEHLQGRPDVPWITTMHGCYETLLDNPLTDLSFPNRITSIIERLDAWAYLAEKNRRVFEIYGHPTKLAKIANGIEVPTAKAHSREYLGIRRDSVVICLASRALEEKGWLDAADIVKDLNRKGHRIDLMLLGEGPAADRLRSHKHEAIHLYGHVEDTQAYMRSADIGILPTYFGGESMPLVLIEMMANGTPVISTDVGEIPAMIGNGSHAGGIVVPLKGGKVDRAGFANAIVRLLDEDLRRRMGMNARAIYEADYTAKRMLEDYDNTYREVIASKAFS